MIRQVNASLPYQLGKRNGALGVNNTSITAALGAYIWLQPTDWTAGGTTWTDSSGNGINFTSQSGTLKAGTSINGIKTLGITSATTVAGIKNSSLSLNAANMTIFMVLNATPTAGVSNRFWDTGTNVLGFITSTSYYNYTNGGGSLAGCSSPSAGTNIILADQFGSGAAGLLTGSGNAIAYYAAGGATASGQNSGGATSVTTLSLGANTSGGEIMNGNLAEVIVYPTALAYTPYQQTLTYLKNKYALQ